MNNTTGRMHRLPPALLVCLALLSSLSVGMAQMSDASRALADHLVPSLLARRDAVRGGYETEATTWEARMDTPAYASVCVLFSDRSDAGFSATAAETAIAGSSARTISRRLLGSGEKWLIEETVLGAEHPEAGPGSAAGADLFSQRDVAYDGDMVLELRDSKEVVVPRTTAAGLYFGVMSLDLSTGDWDGLLRERSRPGHTVVLTYDDAGDVVLTYTDVSETRGTTETAYRFRPALSYAPISVVSAHNGVATQEIRYGYDLVSAADMARPRAVCQARRLGLEPDSPWNVELTVVRSWSLRHVSDDELVLQLPDKYVLVDGRSGRPVIAEMDGGEAVELPSWAFPKTDQETVPPRGRNGRAREKVHLSLDGADAGADPDSGAQPLLSNASAPLDLPSPSRELPCRGRPGVLMLIVGGTVLGIAAFALFLRRRRRSTAAPLHSP